MVSSDRRLHGATTGERCGGAGIGPHITARKSQGKRPDPQWRSHNNPAADQEPLEPLNFGNNSIIGSPPHPVRTFTYRSIPSLKAALSGEA